MIAPDATAASEAFLRMIPRDFAREHLVLSQGSDDGVERLAVAESTDPAVIFNVGVRLGRTPRTEVVDPEALARAIDRSYGETERGPEMDGAPDEEGEDLDVLLREADRDLLSTQGKGPVVKFVDGILFEALGRNASDVHVQPLADRTLVRYRVDGALHTAREIPRNLTNPVVSRIKVMGRMDIAERRTPQDGRASVSVGQGNSARSIDLRISTLPTSYGERVVVRLLDTDRGLRLARLDQIGMPEGTLESYRQAASRANGIVLLTGQQALARPRRSTPRSAGSPPRDSRGAS